MGHNKGNEGDEGIAIYDLDCELLKTTLTKFNNKRSYPQNHNPK